MAVPVILAVGYGLRHGMNADSAVFAALILAVWGGFVLILHLVSRSRKSPVT